MTGSKLQTAKLLSLKRTYNVIAVISYNIKFIMFFKCNDDCLISYSYFCPLI